MRETKEIDSKNRTCFYNNIIDLKDFDAKYKNATVSKN